MAGILDFLNAPRAPSTAAGTGAGEQNAILDAIAREQERQGLIRAQPIPLVSQGAEFASGDLAQFIQQAIGNQAATSGLADILQATPQATPQVTPQVPDAFTGATPPPIGTGEIGAELASQSLAEFIQQRPSVAPPTEQKGPQFANVGAPLPVGVAETFGEQAGKLLGGTPLPAPDQLLPERPEITEKIIEALPKTETGEIDEAAIAEDPKGFFDKLGDDPDLQQLMLGVGIALLQGKGIGDALAQGVAMQQRSAATRASGAAAAAAAKDTSALKRAQARKFNAEADKVASEAGLKTNKLKDFNNLFRTIVGEQGIGTEDAALQAQAQTAQLLLADNPENESMKRIRDQAVTSLLQKADALEDLDEGREQVEALIAEFGEDFVRGLITQIKGL